MSSSKSSKADLVSFEVFLVNKLRQRKKRYLVIDQTNGTLSRSNTDNSYEEYPMDGNRFDLRKTIVITDLFSLLPSESDKRKLRLVIDPHTRPLEIIFNSAASREDFSTLIRTLRSMSTNGNDSDNLGDENSSSAGRGSVGSDNVTAPSRINVFCTTFNVSKQSVPRVSKMRRRDSQGSNATFIEEGVEEEKSNSSSSVVSIDDLYDWIPPDEFDLYFVALQECKSKSYPEWQQLVLSIVNRKFEDDYDDDNDSVVHHGDEKCVDTYKLLTSVSMWGIHGMVIVRERIHKYFSHIHTDTRACGLGGVMGNKGAVGISLQYGDGTSATSTSFAFVNSHLAARAERLQQRQEDYTEICRTLLNRKKSQYQGVQLLHAFDHIFWVGDLNYRIDMGSHGCEDEFHNIVDLVENEHVSTLVPFDQLGQERAQHNVFVGFREGELTFPPTYRLEFGKHNEYNNKRNQSPSWTDRILWRSMPGAIANVEQTSYFCADTMVYSDHRPVGSCFSVLTACGLDRSFQIEDEDYSKFSAATLPARGKSNTLKEKKSKFATIKLGASKRGMADDFPYFTFKKVEYFCRLVDPSIQQETNTSSNWDTQSTGSNGTLVEVSAPSEDEYDESDAIDEDNLGFGDEDIVGGDEDSDDDDTFFDITEASDYFDGDKKLTKTTQKRYQGKRKNSYRRPVQMAQQKKPTFINEDLVQKRQPKGFTGLGFGGGEGTLLSEGKDHCSHESSEFTRYVLEADSGVHANSKLWIRFHASFLEDSPSSTSTISSSKHQMLSPYYFRYSWGQSMLPVIKPFINDTMFLADHQIVVTIHKPNAISSKHGQVIGHGHISLKDIAQSENAWFAIPVLYNGQPAGIVRGEMNNTFAAKLSQQKRKSLLKMPSFGKRNSLSSCTSFADVDEEEEEGGQQQQQQKQKQKEDDNDDETFAENDERKKDNRIQTNPGKRPKSRKQKQSIHLAEMNKSSHVSVEVDDLMEEDQTFATQRVQVKGLEKIQPPQVTNLATNKQQLHKSNSVRTSLRKGFGLAEQRNQSRISLRKSKLAIEQQQQQQQQQHEPSTSITSTVESTSNRPRSGWFSKVGFRMSSKDVSKKPSRVYTYEEIVTNRHKLNLDQTRLEKYLNDEEFYELFELTREEFMQLPKWKRIERKKDLALF